MPTASLDDIASAATTDTGSEISSGGTASLSDITGVASPDSLTPETDKALLSVLPETQKAPAAPTGAIAAGALALSPYAPVVASGWLLNRALTSPRTTWGEPAAGRVARSNAMKNLSDWWGRHVTWGNTPAAREEQALREQYPQAGWPAPYQEPDRTKKLQQIGSLFTDPIMPQFANLPREERPWQEVARTTKISPSLIHPFVQKVAYNTIVDTLNFANTPAGAATIVATGGMGVLAPKIAQLVELGFSSVTASEAVKAASQGRFADALENLGLTAMIAHGAATREIPPPTPPAAGERFGELRQIVQKERAAQPPSMEPDQFTEAAQIRLNELESQTKLNPVEEAERQNLEEGLAEGGDVPNLAAQHGIAITGPKTIEAKLGGETDATRIEGAREIPELEVRPRMGEEAPLRREPEGVAGAQEEPVPTGQPVAAAPPEPAHEPGGTLETEAPPAEEPAAAAPMKAAEAAPEIRGEDLGLGDTINVDGQDFKVTDIDPDTMIATIEDGRRFGIQEVTPDEIIWGEHTPAEKTPGEALEFAPPESVEEQRTRVQAEEKAKAARETEAEKKAKVKYGWAQKKTGTSGDLGQMEIEQVEKRPEGDLFSEGKKLRLRSQKEGGYINADIMRDVMDFGRRLYRHGMDFTSWSREMLRHLGDSIRTHLGDLWKSITGQNILPHARERGSMAIPGGRAKGKTPAQKSLDVFRAEAEKKGFDPEDAKLYDYWKKHLESLPEPGESFRQHSERVPLREVTRANYDAAIASNQLYLAMQIKRAALKRGINFAPEGVTPPLRQGGPLPSQRPGGASKWKPETDEAPPTLNAGNGGLKPPPEGSANGPPPSGPDPGRSWARMNKAKWDDYIRDFWEKAWPRDRKMIEEDPETQLIVIHQRWLANNVNYMLDASESEAFKQMQHLKQDFDLIVDAEDAAVSYYRQLIEDGMHPQKAWEEAVNATPLKPVFERRRTMEPLEDAAADELGIPRPHKIDDPYLARTTNQIGKKIFRVLDSQRGGVGGQLRQSISHFNETREHATMKSGLEKGTQYDEPIQSWWQRERVGGMLINTANEVKAMRDTGALFDTEAAARRASKDGKTAYKVEGVAGHDYWAKSRQQGQFIEHNFGRSMSLDHPFFQMMRLMNTYIRNPNLINPLPHITKNMFFKFVMTKGSPLRLAADWREFATQSNPELFARFEKVFPMPRTHLRVPQLTAREVGTWAKKITDTGLRLNEFSQKYIFQKADPAMRYSLWKSYLRKGMSDIEAANNVWIDLVRYDANSGALSMWKSLPLNFFAAWRTGTYVTMFKALKTQPLKTMAYIGAIEYMREAIYRHTNYWTHLPIDYLEAPLAEAVDAYHKAYMRTQLGKGYVTAYGGATMDTLKIAATTAAFGPGGAQAPDSITKFIQAVFMHGTAADRARAQNMFWGLSQIANVPQEFLAARRDGQWAKHMTAVFANFTLGTHPAILYEPRRLGAVLPENWWFMAKPEQFKQYEAERARREQKGIKAETTYEQRHGVTRGFYQGPEESQIEQLARGAGARTRKTSRMPGH